MSELTISSFNPQISWPFPGATATLRYQYSADFVDSDNQPVLRGLYKDVACTVAAGVLSVPSHTVITTNDAVVNPLATLSAQLISARGNKVWLFQQFSIPESLAPTTTIGDLEIYNQGSSLVLPPDAYLTRDEVIALIATRLPNVILASDVLLGLVRMSWPPDEPLEPIAWSMSDPRVGNVRGTLTAASVPVADGTQELIDSPITYDGIDTSIQTVNAFQFGDWQFLGHGSYGNVNDSLGRADLYAGGGTEEEPASQYAGVAGECDETSGTVYIQSTDHDHLVGSSDGVTSLGNGLMTIDAVTDLIKLTDVPTSDPEEAGAIWRDGSNPQLLISDG